MIKNRCSLAQGGIDRTLFIQGCKQFKAGAGLILSELSPDIVDVVFKNVRPSADAKELRKVAFSLR
jgi:hypothetical protein